jgi:putative two-component system response regulator
MGSTHTADLRDLLRSCRSASHPDAKVALSRIQAEIGYRLNKGSPALDFFVEASRGLTSMRGTAHAEIRMRCLYDCAQFFYFNEHCVEGLEPLKQLRSLALHASNSTWSRKADQFLGVIFADMGDIANALPHYCRAFDVALQLSDRTAETSVLINLGIALNYAGLYREAIPCFERAVQIAAANEDAQFLNNSALTNLAQSHLYLGEFHDGFRVIKKSLAQSSDPTDAIAASGRAIREFTFVQFALELGLLDEARAHAALCSTHALASGMTRPQVLAEMSLAQCQIHGGDFEAGVSALERILARCGSAASKEAVLVALVKAYDQVAQPEKSLECLDALIGLVRAQREKGIVALLSTPFARNASLVSTEDSDLHLFRYREAQLRAKVAERKVFDAQIEMLERFAVTADLRDEISGEHGHRVGRLSALMAAELGWSPAVIYAIELGGRLHDIGKVGVPDRILLSGKELQDIEKRFICAHTIIGAELLGKSPIPHVQMAEEIARYHHEWWNGEGYPAGLAHQRIPIHARIVALADVFDALTHGRPYAPAWPVDKAIDQIANRRGAQFDPELTDVFLRLVAKLQTEHQDLDAYLSKGASSSPFAKARGRIRTLLSAEKANQQQETSNIATAGG